MDSNVSPGLVSSDQRRVVEGIQRVLHASIREVGREEEDVIVVPEVGSERGFSQVKIQFKFIIVSISSLKDSRLSIDACSGTNFLIGNISNCDGYQVGGNLDVLVEGVGDGAISFV